MHERRFLGLCICGTVLVALPFVANLLFMVTLAWLLKTDAERNVNLSGFLSRGAYWAPILLGGAMILAGIVSALRDRREAKGD